MKELNKSEIKQVSGGVLPAVLAGIALGSVAKKLYNKYVKQP
ncbi:class IIb bacteriocin, lactobin A/cerein 7B family [Pseudoalteromonas nigrifaciens]|nr:class IIb bacteriocin, lactobin A/cerein 7B family [Pseudoalteromonas nigrifaciens]MBE0421691.1 class IIb bacteriocin, lactobin A/cerein 7B family [Pseudoalteromonas nigrifaciens]